jgi:hypothetical protein
MKKYALIISLALLSPAISFAADPGKLDIVSLDSITAKPGAAIVLGIKIKADDSLLYNGKYWAGVGSFCLPLKYDRMAIKIDSAKFDGTLSRWDEKFTNAKIDTGFISFVGIYNIGGDDNPVLLTGDKSEDAIRIFGHVSKDAKPGIYLFELTKDPIQNELYFGSTDGMDSWTPVFVPGKVVVK